MKKHGSMGKSRGSLQSHVFLSAVTSSEDETRSATGLQDSIKTRSVPAADICTFGQSRNAARSTGS